MDSFEFAFEDLAEFRRGLPADDGGEQGERTVGEPELELADLHVFEFVGLGAAEGVADEVLDSGEHAGDEVGILHDAIADGDVAEEQAGFAVDEEDLLDAVAEAVREGDFAEGAAGAPCLEAPAPALEREAAVEHEVERIEHALESVGDGLTDGVADDGKERGREHGWIPRDGDAKGLLDEGLERGLELVILFGAERDGFGNADAELFGAKARVVETVTQGRDLLDLGAEQERAKLAKTLFRVVRAVRAGLLVR